MDPTRLQQRSRHDVEPLLASQLVEDAELEALYDGITSLGKTRPKRGGDGERRLGVGVESVDLALEGGVESARLVGVGCELAGGLGNEVSVSVSCSSSRGNLSTGFVTLNTTTPSLTRTSFGMVS